MQIIEKLKYLSAHKVEGFPHQPMNVAEAEQHECKNCHTQYRGNFCPCCGQSAATDRFAKDGIIKELIENFTPFDSTFVRTVMELFCRPGYMISDYIHCKRANYYKPVAMLTSLVALYLLLCLAFSPNTLDGTMDGLGDGLNEIAKDPDYAKYTLMLSLCKGLISLVHNYLILKFYAIFIAVLVFKVVFNWTAIGRETNLAEHFYIRTILICMAMMIDLLVFFPTLLCTGSAEAISGAYCTIPLGIWIYKQYFRISWWKSICLNIIAYILSLILFIALIAALIFAAFAIDYMLI